MNENLILQMVEPYVKDGAITYDEFYHLFRILSIKEQYSVTDILYKNGINLVDKHISEIQLEIDDLEENDEDSFDILYDSSLFKDSGISEDDDFLTINSNIKQSNDILCHLIQDGNKQATQDLCVKNKKLVDKYVIAYQKRYGNRLDFEDLEQVGFVGLIKAANRFDFEQGAAFSTYAVFWIKQAISREIMDNGYAIRIPVHMMERINKVVFWDNSFGNDGYGLEDRIKNIAEELGLTSQEVRECLMLKKNYLSYASLNAPIGEDEESELGEFIPEEASKGTEEIVCATFLREDLEKVVSTLKEREQEVLSLRFGLYDGKPRTLEEVGQIYGLTRERIRQIETKALKKLEHSSASKKLKDYLD